ncbi:PfkB family carbohydrate kinase [Massilia sp. P8910]|uniref:PfkB family carbohydrate kinase n=1 Tax=Massilia antarctica TaxID=2765360 RepID=UPI001E3578E1|nr:PfkB family carbohydrate kinase [Massilia antarctica]
MIVTFGEALVDMIHTPDGRFGAALGGSVCNFTLAAARQSLALTYLNPLSQDAFGHGFADLLKGAGVTPASSRRSACPTSLAIVTLDAGKTPGYPFHGQGVAERDITPRQACALRGRRAGGAAAQRCGCSAASPLAGGCGCSAASPLAGATISRAP